MVAATYCCAMEDRALTVGALEVLPPAEAP